MPAIVGSVVSAILCFLGKAVGFVAEHTWALIVFVAGLIGVWLMQRVSKKQARKKFFLWSSISIPHKAPCEILYASL